MDPQIQAQFQAAAQLIAQEANYGTRQRLEKELLDRWNEWQAPSTATAGPDLTGFVEVPQTASYNAAGERSISAKLIPPEQQALQREETALERANTLAGSMRIPYLQAPERTTETENGIRTIPAKIGYRAGKASDIMAASNPFETQIPPNLSPMQAIGSSIRGAMGAPMPQGRPAIYFGEGLPPVPVDPLDYLAITNLVGEARGQRPVDIASARNLSAPPIPIDTTNLLDLAQSRFAQRPQQVATPQNVTPTAVITAPEPVQARSPVDSILIKQAVSEVGSADRESIVKWLTERGYEQGRDFQ